MTRQQMLRAAALGAVVALSACTPDAADPLLPAADPSLDEVETTLTVISELTAMEFLGEQLRGHTERFFECAELRLDVF